MEVAGTNRGGAGFYFQVKLLKNMALALGLTLMLAACGPTPNSAEVAASAAESSGRIFRDAAGAIICPVARVAIEDVDTAPSTEHRGVTYYFCSPEHQAEFEENLDEFVEEVPEA